MGVLDLVNSDKLATYSRKLAAPPIVFLGELVLGDFSVGVIGLRCNLTYTAKMTKREFYPQAWIYWIPPIIELSGLLVLEKSSSAHVFSAIKPQHNFTVDFLVNNTDIHLRRSNRKRNCIDILKLKQIIKGSCKNKLYLCYWCVVMFERLVKPTIESLMSGVLAETIRTIWQFQPFLGVNQHMMNRTNTLSFPTSTFLIEGWPTCDEPSTII